MASEIRINTLKNRSGLSTVSLTDSGPIFTGIATFTGGVGIAGTLTYEDVTNIDSIGIITARSTVSIADSIIHTGDTNTSLRFPSADTITAETGGLERFRITSDGAVLLGATSASNAESFLINTSDSGKAIIKLTNSTTGTGTGDGFEFGMNGNEQIEFVNKENTDMFFATNNLERLRISSVGHVTKPSHPAFFARPPATYSLGSDTDAVIGGTWSTSDSEAFVRGTLANGTSIWNNTDGIFTVPVTGIYYLHLNLFMRNNTTRRDAMIFRNGTSTSDVIARTEIGDPGEGSNNKSVAVSAVVSLTLNDTIRFGGRTVGGTQLYITAKPWQYACGHLIA